MTDFFKDKKILLFSPAFFGFEIKIKSKLIRLGAECDCFDERSVSSAFARGVLRFFPGVFTLRTRRYYRNIIKKCAGKRYDYVLIVRCDMPSLGDLAALRKAFPQAVFCLHLWDSLQNVRGIGEKLAFFDRISSFDPKDCREHPEFVFRPNFYFDEFASAPTPPAEHDICFCGTVHSDRYSVITQTEAICRERGWDFYTFCYLQGWFVYYVFKLTDPLFRRAKKSDFSFDRLSTEGVRDIESRSRCILDIQHPSQTGLTLRAYEAMLMGRKIITTSADVTEYDFYNPDNILVVDRTAVEIPREFVEKPFVPVPSRVMDNYSLEQWLLDVFTKENEGQKDE